MFGKINDKQDISNIKNVARLAQNFKFVGAPCGNEQASEESLFLIINDKTQLLNLIIFYFYLYLFVNSYQQKIIFYY